MTSPESLSVTPITIKEANVFVSAHHRHHKPVTGAKFAIAVSDESGTVRGVAIIGRQDSALPVPRRQAKGGK